MPPKRRAEPAAGPSSAVENIDNTPQPTKGSALFDIFILFAVPTNVIIPVIYLMIPALKTATKADKLPSTKGVAIAIIVVCSIILCYAVPFFLYWLITKAHQYRLIRLRRYTLMIYGLDNKCNINIRYKVCIYQ